MKGIDHVGIVVQSLDEAKRTLVDTIGMEVYNEVEFPTVKVAFLKTRSGSLLEVAERLDGKIPLDGRTGILDHIAMEVDDLEPLVEQLLAQGVQFEKPTPTVTQRPDGQSRSMSTLPESTLGIRIQFVQNDYA